MKWSTFTASCLAASPLIEAHYIFSKLHVNGKQVGSDFTYVRKNSNSYQPTFPTSLNSPNMRCNSGASQGGATQTYTVAAGSKVGFSLWSAGKKIEHPGPAFIWMSKAPGNASTYDGSGDWFKIFEAGVCGSNPHNDGDWCTWYKPMIEATIPLSTPPGDYLVRPEQIGLHQAQDGKAQFYMECAQIRVTGTGGGKPGPTVKIPGYLTASSPAITYNKWKASPGAYHLPPPAVWTGQ
ncbi:hypothetical protein BT63DRAFT_467679 [Microthyrium microscopicum]|uniref:AA9 family lytic polysaccharide monooxygenase n=1 Tax=Microthyrium microscopicum TaxID=703497 RepID=A0A6A6UJC8_9PEZI|nr:hypothetical protein BT63DRAFT_467679 [Microthyrium microscopicum]